MLCTCVVRFDVTRNLKNFTKYFGKVDGWRPSPSQVACALHDGMRKIRMERARAWKLIQTVSHRMGVQSCGTCRRLASSGILYIRSCGD
jgi:hypothetical protein